MPQAHATSRRTAMWTVASAGLSHILRAEEGREPAPRFGATALDSTQASSGGTTGSEMRATTPAFACGNPVVIDDSGYNRDSFPPPKSGRRRHYGQAVNICTAADK